MPNNISLSSELAWFAFGEPGQFGFVRAMLLEGSQSVVAPSGTSPAEAVDSALRNGVTHKNDITPKQVRWSNAAGCDFRRRWQLALQPFFVVTRLRMTGFPVRTRLNHIASRAGRVSYSRVLRVAANSRRKAPLRHQPGSLNNAFELQLETIHFNIQTTINFNPDSIRKSPPPRSQTLICYPTSHRFDKHFMHFESWLI